MNSRRLITLSIFILLLSFSSYAKDEWITVRSKNFHLIGNAKEKDISKVAIKLEQFRQVFSQLFPKANFDSPIETNVIVFKDAKSYNPFKPKNDRGENDKWLAGYFQPGDDVNYITLSTDGDLEDTYGIIFHEYVHYLLNTLYGKTEIPPWFNEGLAEYYQTFSIKDDKQVTLGGLQNGHLAFLQRNKLMPLKDFFAIDNYSLHRNGNHSRSIFYSQAWLLIHYLIQGNSGSNLQSLNTFLSLIMKDVEPEKAFKQVFKSDYEEMEKALEKYARQRTFKTTLVTFNDKFSFDTDLTISPLAEADANAYLGDLLYHTHEIEDAEIYLQKSLSADANQSLANNAMGLVKMRQKKFADAKKYLEKAVASDQKNHLVHYNYAYILSREDMDEFGFVSGFPSEKAEIMRKALKKSIEISPTFTNSYTLLAFINYVNNENLDESVTLLKKGLSLKPGDQEYLLQLARTYMRQENYKEAKNVAEKLAKNASDDSTRSSSQSLLKNIKALEEQKESIEKARKEYSKTQENTADYSPPKLVRRESLSEDEIKKIEQDREIFSLNKIIKKLSNDESQILGYIQKISCVNGNVIYAIKTKNKDVTLTSKDFQSLELMAHTEISEQKMVGCDAQLQDVHSVITYRTENNPKTKSEGTVLRIDFVPSFFEFKTSEEIAANKPVVIIDEDMEKLQRNMMLQGIRELLRKPQTDEKRAVGTPEKIECQSNNVIFNIKVGDKNLQFSTNSPQEVMFRGFINELDQIKMTCGAKFPPVKVVITYRPNENKTDEGKPISLEFVPNDFELN